MVDTIIEDNEFSYGFELELSDVDKRIDIPDLYGSWEGPKVGEYNMGSELDIVNTLEPFNGHASDPMCVDCHVGGEINVAPTLTIKGQFNRILEIFNQFPVVESGHVNHFHVHVHVPGLKEDAQKMKNMVKWAEANQEQLMNTTYNQNFFEAVGENYDELTEFGREYLYGDGCRLIHPDVFRKVEEAETAEEVLQAFDTPALIKLKGEDIVKSSIRTGINFANLLRGKTLEYRCFRSTTSPYQIFSELMLVKRITEESIKEDGLSLDEILAEGNYDFATLMYIHEHQIGWEKTRYSKDYSPYKYHFAQFREPNDEKVLDFTDIWEIMVKRFYD